MPAKTWRCFHCDDVFTNPRHAAAHFGIDQLQTPGCVAVLRHGESHLLDRIRDMGEQLRRFLDDDGDIMRWQNTKIGQYQTDLRHQEETGYARGIRDMTGPYMVWSNEHRAWWRADRCGYTTHLEAAGRYPWQEAIDICRDARGGWTPDSPPPEIPVREADALAAAVPLGGANVAG